MDKILSNFYSKLDELESKNCLACNYTLQSQKGHSCWKWHRSVTNEYKFMFASEAISLLCLNKEETDYIMKHVQAEWVSELKTFISDPIEIEKKHEFVKEGSMETQCSSQEYFSQECSLIGSTVISDSEMDKSFF